MHSDGLTSLTRVALGAVRALDPHRGAVMGHLLSRYQPVSRGLFPLPFRRVLQMAGLRASVRDELSDCSFIRNVSLCACRCGLG